MTAKRKIVVFGSSGAKILINPENPDYLLRFENAVEDPDLRAVEKLPPELWVLDNGKVVPNPRPESVIPKEPDPTVYLETTVTKYVTVPVEVERVVIKEVPVEITRLKIVEKPKLPVVHLVVGFVLGVIVTGMITLL